MKAKVLTTILMTMMVMGCSKKTDTKEVLDFKEAVYGYMYSAQSMAMFIAET